MNRAPSAQSRIDFHHHLFPTRGVGAALIRDILKRTGYDAANVPLLDWTPEHSLQFMDELHISKALLSAPQDLEWQLPPDARRKFAREMNESAATIVQQHPARFGFFGHIPAPTDIDAALDEMAYCLDELHADGITLTNVYGKGNEAVSLGDAMLEPLWNELHHRKAVVFLHGEQTPSSNRIPSSVLPIPISEVPNETYKGAADLVTSGRKRQYPDVRIVLAHAGGSTPVLAARVAALSPLVGAPLSVEQILEDFRTFYYEIALSGHETNLRMLDDFVTADRLLFGTDFPAVPPSVASWYTSNADRFYETRPDLHDQIMRGNATHLLRLPAA